jgi:hypothetical protein
MRPATPSHRIFPLRPRSLAAHRHISEALTPHPDSYSAFNTDFGALLSHSHLFAAGGNTALVDTIYAANLRKAIPVISDGGDNHSRQSYASYEPIWRN